MSKVPDAWEDEWSTVADEPTSSSNPGQPKKPSSKVSKAQKRAQQAEFNRQLWAEAEGPKETNFFLESRNVVPLRQDFKPPTVLLSRKGPITRSPRPPSEGISILHIKDESSEDEEESTTRELSLAERQAQAAKEREEKQRKYEERRLELFGPQNTAGSTSRSGNSSPGSGTPPHSRSSTPNRGGGGGGGRRARGRGNNNGNNQPRLQQNNLTKELFDASYAVKPDSVYLQKREQGSTLTRLDEIQPVRAPRGPDGTAGFNLANRIRLPDEQTPVPSIQLS